MKARLTLLAATVIFPFISAGEAVTADSGGSVPLEWSKKMADSQIARLGAAAGYQEGRKWDYALHVTLLGLLKLTEYTGDPKYADFVEKSTSTWIKPDGTISGYALEDYSLDNLAPGRTLLYLYDHTGEARYRKAADTLRSQLDTHPRTGEGGFFHKKRYTSQMWLDGLYMGEPFYAAYTQSFGPKEKFDDIVRQFRLIDKHLFNAATGLYRHGWDEAKAQNWANKETGASASFWGRGVGWWMMALVETLEYLPKDHAGRAELTGYLEKTAAGVAKWQDEKSGLWWQVLDQGPRQGNYFESTGSAMFTYALLKGINDGLLPAKYAATARKGYEGIVRDLIKKENDGTISLTQCCKVAGLGQPDKRDGTFEYYTSEPVVSNDLKGVGPFIRAGIETDRFLHRTANGLPSSDKTAHLGK